MRAAKMKQPSKDCTASPCFLCTLAESNPSKRMALVAKYFREIPHSEDKQLVLAMSSIWSIAMTQPDDPEFPMLGIFQCMSELIERALNDKEWLLKGQNIYVPYYAAHIIGSYTMNKEEFAHEAIKAGVISPLVELMKGSLSWVEQRVAVRALGHLASYANTLDAIGNEKELDEIVKVSMEVAPKCIYVVYVEFIMKEKRQSYQCNLLTRGLSDEYLENKKAEEWASQLQCWSIHLLNCFASRERGLNLILNEQFLKEICGMWGGIVNENSSAGIGLIRILCYNASGRRYIAECKEVLKALCNLSRSSDDWQYMAIDCLLLLIQDPHVKCKVIDAVLAVLVDLLEIQRLRYREKVGEAITNAILQEKGNSSLSPISKKLIEEIVNLTHQKAKEKSMSSSEIQTMKSLSSSKKLQGNLKFLSGDYLGAISMYTEALELCPLVMRKDRVVLYSNRAQCHLMSSNPKSAISDATRALCLSNPSNSHAKSLWRRSQAYDMLGCHKESLMDGIMYVSSVPLPKDGKKSRIPYYAARMISKQMSVTWLFAEARSRYNRRYQITSKRRASLHGTGNFPLPTIEEESSSFSSGPSEERRSKARSRRRGRRPRNDTVLSTASSVLHGNSFL